MAGNSKVSRIARSCNCSKIFRKCARSAMLFSLIPITSNPPMQRNASLNNGWFSNAGLSKLVLLKLSITAPQASPAVGRPAALAYSVAAAPRQPRRRVQGSLPFPANFQLIEAMNPCPCR